MRNKEVKEQEMNPSLPSFDFVTPSLELPFSFPLDSLVNKDYS